MGFVIKYVIAGESFIVWSVGRSVLLVNLFLQLLQEEVYIYKYFVLKCSGITFFY